MRKYVLLLAPLFFCAQTTAPTALPVAAPISGKLGAPIDLLANGLAGWTWIQRPSSRLLQLTAIPAATDLRAPRRSAASTQIWSANSNPCNDEGAARAPIAEGVIRVVIPVA